MQKNRLYSDNFEIKSLFYANALNFIKDNFKIINQLDFNKSYDSLLIDFLKDDYSNNEILFLKQGINEIYKAKLFFDNYIPKKKEYFYKYYYGKYINNQANLTIDKRELSEEEFISIIEKSSNREEKNELVLFLDTKELLKTELLIFKSKIERVGYITHFQADSVSLVDAKSINSKNNLLNNDNFENLVNNYPLTKHTSNKAKIVLNEILIKKTSLVDVIDCIDNNSNSETKDILVRELISTYRIISNEFMFKVNESDIIDALETYSNNLEYVYIGAGDYSKIQGFVRKIKGFTTVYNVDGLLKVEFENSIKLVLLNNLMIDYFNGFFANEIEGFENICHYKYINKYLLEKYREEPLEKESIVFEREVNNNKELHNHIFKGNAFEVWQYMFDEFNINESSRTDIKFMFEEMKKTGEGLIHKTVSQKTFLEWITSTYDGLIIEKTSNHNRTNSFKIENLY